MRKAILITATIGLVAFGTAIGVSQKDNITSWLSKSDQVYGNRADAPLPVARIDEPMAANVTETADETAATATTTEQAQTTEVAEAATPAADEADEDSTGTMSTPVNLDDVQTTAGSEDKTEVKEEAAKPAEEAAKPAEEAKAADTGALKIDIYESLVDRELGDKDAAVTVYDFSSLNCPHCAHFHNEIFPKLKKNYIDTGKVRWVFRSYPLNEVALRLEMVARCVGNGVSDQYTNIVSMLFKNQPRWAFSDDPLSNAAMMLRVAGINDDTFNACSTNKEFQEGLLKNIQAATELYTIRSTPTFVLNNGAKKFSGAGTYELFAKDLDDLLQSVQPVGSTEIPADKLFLKKE